MLGLGLAVAYLISPNAAVAIVNVIYMLLAFASGFLAPMNQLPNFVQQLAVYLPTYHYAQLAWGAIGVSSENVLVSGGLPPGRLSPIGLNGFPALDHAASRLGPGCSRDLSRSFRAIGLP